MVILASHLLRIKHNFYVSNLQATVSTFFTSSFNRQVNISCAFTYLFMTWPAFTAHPQLLPHQMIGRPFQMAIKSQLNFTKMVFPPTLAIHLPLLLAPFLPSIPVIPNKVEGLKELPNVLFSSNK